MPRRNIGVAIGIPEPFRSELQDWRERLGDPQAKYIPPHVTLLPPTAVAAELIGSVEDHLRVIARVERPFPIVLRGSGTFRPVSPVVFVPLVAGISDCERLEVQVRSGPLARPSRFNYHPHVTVAHDVPEDVLNRAFADLADYYAEFDCASFQLFEQDPDEFWNPIREFFFDGA